MEQNNISLKEKAKELVDKYKGLVYPYIGSSMLTNDADEGVILMNSKHCALINIDENIKSLKILYDTFDAGGDSDWWFRTKVEEQITYLNEIKQEINKL